MFTILGASGFIGSHVAARLRERGEVLTPPRGTDPRERPWGHVIYCIGLTSDFRARPFETIEAHVTLLARWLQEADFESFLYCSSTRVYEGAAVGCEDATLTVDPARPEHVFNLSKLCGENLCLRDARQGVRVARLSNVVGADWRGRNFLIDVLLEAAATKHVTFRTALDSAKDYVTVEDVAALLPRLAVTGRQRLYNVASGVNTTHAQIAAWLEGQGVCTDVAPGAPTLAFPPLDISRLRAEFGFAPSPPEHWLAPLYEAACTRVEANP